MLIFLCVYFVALKYSKHKLGGSCREHLGFGLHWIFNNFCSQGITCISTSTWSLTYREPVVKMEGVGWQGLWISWGRVGRQEGVQGPWATEQHGSAPGAQGSEAYRAAMPGERSLLRLQGVELDVRNGSKCSTELSSPDQKCSKCNNVLMDSSLWMKSSFYLSGCSVLFWICSCLCPWSFHPGGTFLGLWVIWSPGCSVPSSLLLGSYWIASLKSDCWNTAACHGHHGSTLLQCFQTMLKALMQFKV